MRTSGKKDPLRQWQGKVSKAKGERFESELDFAFTYYSEKGLAYIEKTPEPMRIIKSLGGGRFVACFKKKAQSDYKGTIKGGRSVIFEAKYTDSDRMEQSRVTVEQSEYIEKHYKLGAMCHILAGFGTGNVYRIPWEDWCNMKALFGRKYVKETDLEKYKVSTGLNGRLMILAKKGTEKNERNV